MTYPRSLAHSLLSVLREPSAQSPSCTPTDLDYINHRINIQIMSIKPLADRVLIRPAAQEEKTVSGIIIPDSAKEKPLRGEVIAVGGGTKDEEMVLKAGDVVLYGKYAGTEIEHEGEKYLIMRQSDVLATI